MSEKILKFKGNVFNGEMDLDKVKFVCIPSKPQYAAVDLCLTEGENSFNIVIGEILNRDLSFEEKKKLGYEIERRWNSFKAMKEESK